MPRSVDHNQRRRDVANAAIRLLASGGPSAVTLRSIADELGGSITMITHYFPNRSAIFEAVNEQLMQEGFEELAHIAEDLSPAERLRSFMQWLLPTTIETLELERSRVALNAEPDPSIDMREVTDRWEREMREAITRFLEPLIPPAEMPFYVDLIRVVHNGVVLSAVEHRDYWTSERQLSFIDSLVPIIEHAGSSVPSRRR